MLLQVKWGIDLSSEHERYLAERVFKSPVIVYNYPKEIKVGFVDLPVPRHGVVASLHAPGDISERLRSMQTLCKHNRHQISAILQNIIVGFIYTEL